MKAIVKLIGVPAERLSALYARLNGGPEVTSTISYRLNSVSGKEEKIHWTKILRATSKGGEGFLVEIEAIVYRDIKDPVAKEGGEEKVLQGTYRFFPPASVGKALDEALEISREGSNGVMVKIG